MNQNSFGFTLFIFIALLLLGGCNEDLLTELPQEYAGELVDVAEIRMVSYNIHGGVGPNGEDDFVGNLTAFEEMLQGEDILCMQEVEPDCWNQLKSIFSDYQYRYFLPQKSTKFGTKKEGGNAIFSKFPIVVYDQRLIQIDPGGDKWERRAQYVKVHIGFDNQYLNLFHYHNTYNWHENNSASEKEGFERFVEFVQSKSLNENELNVMLGDFNLSSTQCDAIVPSSEYPYSQSNWVDQIYFNGPALDVGIYNTVGVNLSDHQAVWAVLCNQDC